MRVNSLLILFLGIDSISGFKVLLPTRETDPTRSATMYRLSRQEIREKSNDWYEAIRDENQSIMLQKEILRLESLPSTEMKQELLSFGISSGSIKDRYELIRVLADARLRNRKANPASKPKMESYGAKAKRSKVDSLKLKKVLEEVNQLTRVEVQRELFNRNIQYSPTYDRHTLNVILARDTLASARPLPARQSQSALFKNATETVHSALRNSKDNLVASLNTIGEVASELSSTESEYAARQKIIESKRAKHSNTGNIDEEPSNCMSDLSTDVGGSAIQFDDSTAAEMRAAKKVPDQLQTFDQVRDWASHQSRRTLCALLEAEGGEGYSPSAKRERLATLLADTVMTRRTNEEFMKHSYINREGNINDRSRTKPTTVKSSGDSLRRRLDSFGDATPMKEILASFDVERELVASVPLRFVSSVQRLFAFAQEGVATLLRHGLFRVSSLFSTTAIAGDGPSRGLLAQRSAAGSAMIANAFVKIARWSGSQVLTAQQVLVLAVGYALLASGGVRVFVTSLLTIKLICSTITGLPRNINEPVSERVGPSSTADRATALSP